MLKLKKTVGNQFLHNVPTRCDPRHLRIEDGVIGRTDMLEIQEESTSSEGLCNNRGMQSPATG